MGRVPEQSYKNQKKHRVRQRLSNSYAMVGGLFGKPSYVDIPNDSVNAMKPMDPQEVAKIHLSKVI